MASQQVTGNVGMYYAAYRLSRMGWNVMPTSRNARGIDLLIYDSGGHYRGIQVKALSKHGAVPLGIKGVDNLLGNWWIIVNEVANASSDPKCFIMTPDEVKNRAVRDEHKARAYWLPAKQYHPRGSRDAARHRR
jgi:hypothetical protein